jgi:hypothetical protein
MTRHESAEQPELPGILTPLPLPPASGVRAAESVPFRFIWRRRGQDDLVVDVPRRDADHGRWPNGVPRQVIAEDDAACERAMRRHAEQVAAVMGRGRCKGEAGQPERPTADATRIRALLLTGSLDHYDLAEKLGVEPATAAHALTHLRNTGHIHKDHVRKRMRTNAADSRPSRTVGVWALTAQGRAAAKREARTGKRLTTYNDAGYRSSGAT